MRSGLREWFSLKENIYLAFALSCGLFMAVVNPPFEGVPDEHPHYWKAWAVALGDMTCRSENAIPMSAFMLPSEVPLRVDLPGVKGKRIVFARTWEKLFEPDAEQQSNGASALCGALPLAYFPQALGLRVGRFFHGSALISFFLGRICNLLVTVFVMYWAIRLIPFGKTVLLVFCLLPMTLQQAAGFGYDALHIASCYLFIAYVLKLAGAAESQLRLGEAVALFAIGLLVCNVKYGYLGLLLLILLLPLRKFGTRRNRWLFSLGFLAVNLLVFYAGYRFLQAYPQPGAGGMANVSDVDQARHVGGAPSQFLMVVLNSLYMKFNFYFETFLYKPGWLRASLPPMWYVLMVAGMFLLIRNEDEPVPLTMRQRWVILLTFLANLFAVMLAMYVSWTPVGAPRVEGVQGRYFLCFSPLLVLFFYKSGFTFRFAFVRRNLARLLVVFYLVMLGWAFLSLYEIYYDKQPKTSLLEKVRDKFFASD
jgi:uncharacterized membrane protein